MKKFVNIHIGGLFKAHDCLWVRTNTESAVSIPESKFGHCNFTIDACDEYVEPVETVGIDEALEVANDYAGFDGAHHKDWVIDQMVRKLLVTEDAYKEWIAKYKNGENGENTYDWDEGIAP